MINKMNKLYAIFDEDVVLSKNGIINAITGMDIVKTVEVASERDIINFLRSGSDRRNNIYMTQLYKFELTAREKSYYVNNMLIATQEKSLLPEIKLLQFCDKALITSWDFFNAFRSVIDVSTVKKVYQIGNLSNPHNTTVGLGGKYDLFTLPLIIS